MRKKISRKWILIIPIFVAILIIGIVFRLNLKDSGIAGMKSQEDIPVGVRLEYAWGENSRDEEGLTEDDIGRATGWNGIASAPVIAVVTSTGNIEASMESFGQEITIKEIIRGEDMVSVGETGYVYQPFAFAYREGEVQFREAENIMQEGYEYLIFVEKSPLSPYMGEPVFNVVSDLFGYIRTDGHETETLDRDYRNYDFRDLKEYEFFSVSEKITNTLNALRKEILSEYLNN